MFIVGIYNFAPVKNDQNAILTYAGLFPELAGKDIHGKAHTVTHTLSSPNLLEFSLFYFSDSNVSIKDRILIAFPNGCSKEYAEALANGPVPFNKSVIEGRLRDAAQLAVQINQELFGFMSSPGAIATVEFEGRVLLPKETTPFTTADGQPATECDVLAVYGDVGNVVNIFSELNRSRFKVV